MEKRMYETPSVEVVKLMVRKSMLTVSQGDDNEPAGAPRRRGHRTWDEE